MNQRNLLYVYPLNQRQHFPLADNKQITKTKLGDLVAVPRSYFVYDSFFALRNLHHDLSHLKEFVIKPAQGSGGGGIMIIKNQGEGLWQSSDETLGISQIRKHITDILFGVYSFGLNDSAIIEEMIKPHPVIHQISPFGLSDIRLIMYKGKPAMAMMRAPTKRSQGKANLHQGAIGIGIDLQSGITQNAIFLDKPVQSHIDNGNSLVGIKIPMWQEVLSAAEIIAKNVPLGYIGIDLCLTKSGPVLLEINVRPGIAIQDINAKGLRGVLQELDR